VTTTLTVRGQTTVPVRIRKAWRLKPGDRLEWGEDGRCIRVVPQGDTRAGPAFGRLSGVSGLRGGAVVESPAALCPRGLPFKAGKKQ
jgi:bifunctional DNA-binding transcriptional regulator/antitoxin component of YhaV-PrlF toxin-antitoxin module